ncbi:MAG: hypothetical protein GY870_00765 [archaeon]|nr:hypothetical protein [archaeon]
MSTKYDINKITSEIVNSMIEQKSAEKIEFSYKKPDKKYYNLMTPNAFNKEFVCILAQGFPEKLGIWATSLIKQNRISESSMEKYFNYFKEQNWGLIAIYPHFFGSDFTGKHYLYQLQKVTELIKPNTKIGFIGFSAGGLFTLKFLNKNRNLAEKSIGIVLIDPVTMKRRNKQFISDFRNKIILFAADCEGRSLGLHASKSLNLPAIMIKGVHGEIPNKSLNKIIDFFEGKLSI